MGELSQREDRYLRAPRFFVRGGRLHVAAIAWCEGRGEAVLEAVLDAQGVVVGEQLGAFHPGIVALRDCTTGVEPVLAPDFGESDPSLVRVACGALLEDRVHAGGYTLRVASEGPLQRVWCDVPRGDSVLVFETLGSVAAPALSVTEDGAWLAFHHDRREDDGHIDVAKWIAVFFVDAGGALHEPVAPMGDRDRDSEGVEQSFEFPALVVGPDGALSVLGRGSHNFWRQDLTAQGFTARIPLSDGEWGSRGRRIHACLFEGFLWVVRRERRALQIDRRPMPSGGRPALRPYLPRRAAVAVRTRSSVRDSAARNGHRTLFGDIQQHSAHSDGLGSAEEVYVRARYRYGDDFVALTDHEAFLGKRTGPGEWAYLQAVAEAHDAPGEFAALIAYEWTGKMFPGPGHKCVYYPRLGLPIVSRDRVPVGGDLVREVRTLGGFASPHHIGWTGADELGHDDQGQPLWEICSCHGCYEHVEHPLGQRGELRDQMADEMLRRGHKFGFTASSDSHGLLWHHGESRKRDPYRTGLTAVQASDCTRAAVQDALAARRCYATSGVKILLDLRGDGAAMGSQLGVGPVHFEALAEGTDALARLELVGPGGVVACGQVRGAQGSLSARLSLPWVYARVVQVDGEMAWSSPIFCG